MINLKNIFFILAALMAASFVGYGQTVKEIKFNYEELSRITGSADLGNVLPISVNKSIINIGQAHLALLENSTGKILKFSDENELKRVLEKTLLENHKGVYSVFSDEEILKLPTCQGGRFLYLRILKVEESNDLFACEIFARVKVNDGSREYYSFKGIAHYTSDLELVDFFERDDEGNALRSYTGGFFIGKNHFFIKKVLPDLNEPCDFFYFKLTGNTYTNMGGLKIIESASKPHKFPGRFVSSFKSGNDHYIYNGTKMLKTRDLFGMPEKEIDLKLKEDEFLNSIYPIDKKTLVGLNLINDERGLTFFAQLFTTDFNFSRKKVLREYDQIKIRVNSMEVFEGKAYLFLFDRVKNKYLLDIVDIKS